MKNRLLKNCMVCSCIFIFNTSASAMSYSEADSGDLLNYGLNVFYLDNGINTISGSMIFDTSGSNDADPFVVSLEGGVLESITYSYTTTSVNGLSSLGYNPALYSRETIISGDELLGFAGGLSGIPVASGSDSEITLFVDELQGVRGIADVFSWHDTWTYLTAQTGSASWDYTVTLNVSGISNVPIPSAIYFMVSGLIGLMTFKRGEKRT